MKNEWLVTHHGRLARAKSLNESAEEKLQALHETLSRAEVAYEEHAHCREGAVKSFLDMHEAKCEKYKAAYEAAMSDKAKAQEIIERVCGDIKRYVMLNCIRERFCVPPLVMYEPYSDYVEVHYFIDACGRTEKDEVMLRIFIGGEGRYANIP